MKYLPFLSLLLLGLPLVVFGQDATFVPLTTGVPFLENVGNADSLSTFLNDIYKVCIGVAATLAVLQIMRAGIMYMGGDSVTEKKEAKNLIAMSIGGLILVLSPVVVFSIINPEILSLEIKGLSQLAGKISDWDASGVDAETRNTTAWNTATIDRQGEKARCEFEGGRIEFSCRNNTTGVERKVPETEACANGETNVNRCIKSSVTESQTCPANLSRTREATRSCSRENGYEQIPKSCCSLPESSTKTCCGSTDGRGSDDPSIASFYTQKTFQTRALADTFAQACSDIRTHDRLVAGREGNVKQLERPAGSTNTPYLGQCFSFSVEFGEFQIWEKSTQKMVKFGDLSSGDVRYSNFKNGCEDDGGQVQYRNPVRTSFTSEQCRRQGVNEAGVFSQYPGTGPETHVLLCRSEAHICKR
jgi:type IV secretory pathway VirB2 component (pilin)